MARKHLVSGPDVEGFACFEERFQAGEHAWPAPGYTVRHRRPRLEIAVGDAETHHIFDWLDLERDTRTVCCIVRIHPGEHQSPGRHALQDFADHTHGALLVVTNMLPS